MKLPIDRKHIPLLATAGVLVALFVTAALMYRGSARFGWCAIFFRTMQCWESPQWG